MKAFTVYPTEEFYARYLFKQLQYYGEINCDFETFSKLYEEWCEKTFPKTLGGVGMPKIFESLEIVWIEELILYLSNKDI